jgi:hypothetical protein
MNIGTPDEEVAGFVSRDELSTIMCRRHTQHCRAVVGIGLHRIPLVAMDAFLLIFAWRNRMHHLIRTAAVCAFAIGVAASVAAQAPDNTKVNRDRQAGATSADQQSNAKSDVETTREIRRAIVADKSLSTNAHNVKIITNEGKVTLKGPVMTNEEKQTVESKAGAIAGPANVISHISVKDASNKSQTTSHKKER